MTVIGIRTKTEQTVPSVHKQMTVHSTVCSQTSLQQTAFVYRTKIPLSNCTLFAGQAGKVDTFTERYCLFTGSEFLCYDKGGFSDTIIIVPL